MTIKELKKKIILTSQASSEGHIPSSFSILDILYVLHNGVLKAEDRFILSKGHASLGLYAVLADKGVFGWDVFESFCKPDSLLGGHPSRGKAPGVLASTGSLGHGFPMAVGMSLAKKIKKEDGRVFCIIGDGEANEGSIWEACLIAGHRNLNNLTCIVDYNHSTDRAIELLHLCDKFTSFGFSVKSIDGHDHESLMRVLSSPRFDRPSMVIAHTVSGKGCKPIESNPAWHHRPFSIAEAEVLIQELV
jgi:transketolase